MLFSLSVCPGDTLAGGLVGGDDIVSPRSSSFCPAPGLLEGCLPGSDLGSTGPLSVGPLPQQGARARQIAGRHQI